MLIPMEMQPARAKAPEPLFRRASPASRTDGGRAADGETLWRGPEPISKTADSVKAAPQPPAVSKPCLITTRAIAAAPGGAADNRKRVGVGEFVELTASVPVKWKATGGSFGFAVPAKLNAVTWTAPETAATCVITAEPPKGTVCTVTLNVIAPTALQLTRARDIAYPAGRSGSGFFGAATITPLDVSFSRIEVREETATGAAEGYYKDVLGWNGAVHPQTIGWARVGANNGGFTDMVGTLPEGNPGPFSVGTFVWPIPQSYRVVGGSGAVYKYSIGFHVQAMGGGTGAEHTQKEGASRSRVP